MNGEPWWVEGAWVHGNLSTPLDIFCHLSGLKVKQVDNTDGFCLREQLWHDGLGDGFNTKVTRMFRAASRRMRR